MHGPPFKSFSPGSPSSLCSWVVSAPLTFHMGVVTKRRGKEGKPPCDLGKGWLGQTGRPGAVLWEVRKGLPPEGSPPAGSWGPPAPHLVQQALAWSSTSPCRGSLWPPSPDAPGLGGGRGRSRNVGSGEAAAWLMGQRGGSLTPREAPARCGLRTGAPDRTLCSQVTCHSLNGRCQLKVKSNTCYCCDLYDCHR